MDKRTKIVYIDRPNRITMDNGDYTVSQYLPDGTLTRRTFCSKRIETVTKVNADGDTIVRNVTRTTSNIHDYMGSFWTMRGETAAKRVLTPTGYVDLTTGKRYWYLTNRQGSTMAVVDETGAVVQRNGYYPSGTPFVLPSEIGEDPAPSMTAVTDQLHIGNRWLSHAGLNLYDNTARFHDPLLMRFTAPDPLAEMSSSVSIWAHCHSNPINFVDGDGRREWPVDNPYKGVNARHSNDFNQDRPGLNHHWGVDINMGSGKFDLDAPIYATHDGIVVRKASYTDGNGGGNRIKIQSTDNKVATFYMHLNQFSNDIKVGDYVKEGTFLGTIGGSGKGKMDQWSPHLHYEMFLNGKRINPAIDKSRLVDPQLLLNPTEQSFQPIVLDEVIVTGQGGSTPSLIPTTTMPRPDPSRIEISTQATIL